MAVRISGRSPPGDADAPAAELAKAWARFYQPRRLVEPLGGVTPVTWDDFDLLRRAEIGRRLTRQRAVKGPPELPPDSP